MSDVKDTDIVRIDDLLWCIDGALVIGERLVAGYLYRVRSHCVWYPVNPSSTKAIFVVVKDKGIDWHYSRFVNMRKLLERKTYKNLVKWYEN
jgi:hypothetical protein